MSFEVFKNIVDYYKEAVNISLVGSGEPLLNADFFKMVNYAKTVRHTRVTSLSNGLFNENKMRLLLNSGLDSISISIKGYNQEDFQRLTGVDKTIFEEVIHNTRQLVTLKRNAQSRLDIFGSFIVDKQNFQYINNMIELTQDLGMDKVKFDTYLPYPFSGFTLEERCITSQDIEIVNFLKNINYKKYSIDVRPLRILDLDRPGRMCHSAFTSIRVDSDGNVGACNVKLLNLENNGKYFDDEVWNNEYFKNMRHIFLKNNPNIISEDCLTCYEYSGVTIV